MAMAKDKCSDTYLWGTEMWHKRLINYDEKPSGLVARLFGMSSSYTGNSSKRNITV